MGNTMPTTTEKKTQQNNPKNNEKLNNTSNSPLQAKSTPTPPLSKSGKNDYFEFKIPKINYANLKLSPVWVILLLVFAYLLGMQTAKLTYIEKKMAEDNTTVAPAQPSDPNKPVLGTKVNVAEGTLPALGKKNAKVTIVEFSDFQCPFCEKFYKDTFAQLKKDYIDTGKIKFTFRHLPLDIHPLATKASEASECANDQGKFWEYHDELFNNFSTWTTLTTDTLQPQLEEYASSLGLNTQEFSSCLTSDKYTEKVNKDKTDAQTAGATGTPSFFINGKILVGALPFETFKILIDQELK